LLERFYDVQQGQISLDETGIKEMNLHHLRSHMALVGQEPVLFNLTLRENIAYGLEGMNIEEVMEAARQANIHDFIRALPKVSCLFDPNNYKLPPFYRVTKPQLVHVEHNCQVDNANVYPLLEVRTILTIIK
jgi:ABC-type multidrug transport system fused ATPase/permease subunit